MMFINRNEAAHLLVEPLAKYKNCKGVILAIPRGGVPLGCILSDELNLPLDLILIKKIGHPTNKEYAIGAMSLHGMQLAPQASGIPKEYIEKETEKLRKQLLEKLKLYDGKRKQYALNGKVAIVVDDGVATGSTLLSAIEIIRQQHPKKIVVAVPVAHPQSAQQLKHVVDDFICLHTPEEFQGVGEFYADFSPVNDEEVIALMQQAEKTFVNKSHL